MKKIISMSGAASAALLMSLAISQAQTIPGGNKAGAPAADPGAAGEMGGAGRAHPSMGAGAPAAKEAPTPKGGAAEMPSERKPSGHAASGAAKDGQDMQSPSGANAGGRDKHIGASEEQQGKAPRHAGAKAKDETHRSVATQVSAEDRTKVRSEIWHASIKDAGNIDVNVRVGGIVPRTITEYWMPVPDSIVAIVPAWSAYRVVRVGDEILIIEPGTFRIVDVIGG
jgi:hypothetical protein